MPRRLLGVVAFVAAIGFHTGLMLSMVGFAWDALSYRRAIAGLAGFGIPMMLLGSATISLWKHSWRSQRFFGWMAALSALFWATVLFITVANWVGITTAGLRSDPTLIESVVTLVGCLVPMCASGGAAIQILTRIDDSRETHGMTTRMSGEPMRAEPRRTAV